jgi:2-polyprenyl-3-methyl-5-hydroxy-6-metoxy-1,4-benzoquinol methylase
VQTEDEAYARRLQEAESVWWKRLLDVQAPYRWNLRRQRLGRTLDIGCGIGRNLASLPAGSVGVDHNESSIRIARERGMEAYTVEEFFAEDRGQFDAFLVAHVIEHLDEAAGLEVMRSYLPYLRRGGRVFVICPQERGFASDPTHVRWTTGEDLLALARDLGLEAEGWRSFPLPRRFGRLFTYNEFNLLATKP